MTSLPNLTFFTDVPYSQEWRDEFKDYFQGLEDPNDALYLLNRFANNLDKIKDKDNLKSKGIQVANRLHELKERIFIQKKKIREEDVVKKVGTVLVRKDNKALFTIEKGKDKLGFPKGQYEYKLSNPNDIYSVDGEGHANGALRELQEETGFQFTGKIQLQKAMYTGILERTVEGKKDKLSILGGEHITFGDRFYLVLFVDSTSDLQTEKVPENTENIEKVVWEHQYTKDTTKDYNTFSKHRFEFPKMDYFVVENNVNSLYASPPVVKGRKHSTRKKNKTSSRRSHSKSKSRKRSKTRSI